MIRIFDAHLLAELCELSERFVGAVGIQKHIMVDLQIIAGTIADQHIAVGIQNITTGCANTGNGCIYTK